MRSYNVKITREPIQEERSFRNSRVKTLVPPKVDLRPYCPPVYNQGSLGSCTANALCAAHSMCDPDITGSRLFLYYNIRLYTGNVDVDTGASIFDGVRSMEKYGICKEMSFPYIIANFQKAPPPPCYEEALNHKAIQVRQVENEIQEMKQCLASGLPIVCGIQIYSSFESPSVDLMGIADLPKEGDSLLGGHAILVVGYDDATQRFNVRNSWGMFWGDQGYFTIPYEYLLSDKYCSDLWVIEKVTEDPKDETLPARCLNCMFPFLQSCRTGLV